MPRFIALIGPWIALTATCGLASDSPSDAAPLAPLAPTYAQGLTDASTSNVNRNALTATDSELNTAPQLLTATPPPSDLPPALLQASATEPIASEPLLRIPTTAPIAQQASGGRLPEKAPLLGALRSPLSMPFGAANKESVSDRATPTNAFITVGSSLIIVLGLFFFLAWAMRKAAPRGSIVLPADVFEILGKAPLGSRQQVQLVRCGHKLLLLSITPTGTETLTEVTDPLEVDRLAGICRQGDPRSSTKAFQQVFQQLAPRSGSPGPIDELDKLRGRRNKSYRWESEHV